MTVSTTEEKFDSDAAERLLKDVEPRVLEQAHQDLRHSYLVYVDAKRRPGRVFRYHDACVNNYGIYLFCPTTNTNPSRQNSAIFGVFPETLYQDADDLEEDVYTTKGWFVWPQIGSDGSVAALLAMLSDRKVRWLILTLGHHVIGRSSLFNLQLNVNIDPPEMREVKALVLDNSKKNQYAGFNQMH